MCHWVQEQQRLYGALFALRILTRKYEFKDEEDRVPLGTLVDATFPILLRIFQVRLNYLSFLVPISKFPLEVTSCSPLAWAICAAHTSRALLCQGSYLLSAVPRKQIVPTCLRAATERERKVHSRELLLLWPKFTMSWKETCALFLYSEPNDGRGAEVAVEGLFITEADVPSGQTYCNSEKLVDIK